MKKMLLVMIGGLLLANNCLAYQIGVISDIHAGSKVKITKGKHGLVYPKRYKKCLATGLSRLEKKGVDTVIFAGDMVDENSSKYLMSVKKIADKYPMDQVLVRGNHESEALFAKLSKEQHYYVDKGDNRIIVLDNVAKNNLTGFLDDNQLEWLQNTLADSQEKQVVIVLHHPIFSRSSKRVYDKYELFHDLVKANPNVKYVISGHWHKKYTVKEGETTYHVAKQLCGHSVHTFDFSL